MTGDGGGDFGSVQLADEVLLHLRREERFKAVRIEVLIQDLLQRRRNTRLALLARLLERGTRRLPDLRSLNRFTDELYGALFGVDVDQLGDRQVLHLSLEVLDRRCLPAGEDLLEPGIAFLFEVLQDPAAQDGRFRQDYLRQEKAALRLSIAAQFNDKTFYAQRRCVEEMCRGEACALPVLGDTADFRGISAARLSRYHQGLLAASPVDVFVSGWCDPGQVTDLVARSLPQRRRPARLPAVQPSAGGGRAARCVFERQEVSQGRLVMGYRTHCGLTDAEYPALGLLNLLWGGDSQSRLFRRLREEQGMCYYIGSHMDPLCGLLFVAAGVEARDYEAATEGIAAQLESLRQGRFERGEVEGARSLLLHRLLRLDDDRAGLARLHYRRRVAGGGLGRAALAAAVARVQPQEICQAAGRLQLDTVYYLHDGQVALPSCN